MLFRDSLFVIQRIRKHKYAVANVRMFKRNFSRKNEKVGKPFLHLRSALFLSSLRIHTHGLATQLSREVFLIRSTMLIARRTLTGPCRRLTCYYARIAPIPLQSCYRHEMRESGARRVGKGMEQEDETLRTRREERTRGETSRVLSLLNQHLLLHASESSQTETHRGNLKISSEGREWFPDCNVTTVPTVLFLHSVISKTFVYPFELENDHHNSE